MARGSVFDVVSLEDVTDVSVNMDESFADLDLVLKALNCLSPRNSEIMKSYFGIGPEVLSRSELSNRYGISSARVSQIIEDSIYRIQKHFCFLNIVSSEVPSEPKFKKTARQNYQRHVEKRRKITARVSSLHKFVFFDETRQRGDQKLYDRETDERARASLLAAAQSKKWEDYRSGVLHHRKLIEKGSSIAFFRPTNIHSSKSVFPAARKLIQLIIYVPSVFVPLLLFPFLFYFLGIAGGYVWGLAGAFVGMFVALFIWSLLIAAFERIFASWINVLHSLGLNPLELHPGHRH